MSLVRVLLLLIAVGTAYLLVRWSERAPATSASLLREVQALRAAPEPDFETALWRAGQGIDVARERYEDDILSALLRERLLLLRARWEEATSRPATLHDPADLEQVIDGCRSWLSEYDPQEAELLALGARCCLDLARPAEALEFLLPLERLQAEDARVAMLQARARLGLAREGMRSLWGELSGALPGAGARRTLEDVRRAAARPADDPRRIAFRRGAVEELPSSVRGPTKQALEELGETLRLALASCLRTLELAPDGRAVAGVQTVLNDAGEPEISLHLGRLALERPGLEPRAPVEHQVVRALLACGQHARAAEGVRAALVDDQHPFEYETLSDDDLISWCRIAHGLERWSALAGAAGELRQRSARVGDPAHLDGLASFFLGLARSEQGQLVGAASSLARVPLSGSEPYRGLRLELWYGLARAAEAAGKPRERRAALRQATEAAPLRFEQDWLDRRLARVAGEAWLELGRLLLLERESQQAERALTHALRLLPSRRAEIEADWERAGLASLERRGRVLESLRVAPGQRRGDGTFPELGAWEACQRARISLEIDRPFELDQVLMPVLDEFPGLGAALELRARDQLQRGRPERAVEALLSLAEAGDETPEVRRLLLGLPRTAFGGNELRRWARMAPRAALFAPILADLEALEDVATLTAMLEAVPATEYPRDARVRAAVAAAHLGQSSLALGWLASLPAASSETAASASLALHCALDDATSSSPAVAQVVARVLQSAPLRDPDLPRAVDRLIAAGHVAEAQRLVEAEAAPALGPRLLLRRAVLALLADQESRAEDALEQAEALLEDELALLGRTLLSIRSGDRARAVRGARALSDTVFARPPLQRAMLTALAGDVFGAGEQLVALPADPDGLPSWADVAAHLILARVPRAKLDDGADALHRFEDGPNAPWEQVRLEQAFCIALAAGTSEYAALAQHWIADLPAKVRDTPAAALLQAAARESVGDLPAAEQTLAPWCRPGDFARVWFERERIALERLRRAPPAQRPGLERELWTQRAQRLTAIGARGTSAGMVARIGAWKSATPEQAWFLLSRAEGVTPDDEELRLALARAGADAGHWLEAADLFESLLRRGPDVVPELLEALRRAQQVGELDGPGRLERLEVLARRRHAHPSVVLALHEARLEADPGGGGEAALAALAKLERFRARFPDQAIESMRAGEGLRWTAFYARIDPVRAERFAAEELAKRPGSLPLWRAWCASLQRLGRGPEALAHAEALTRVVPDPWLADLAALLRLELSAGTDAEQAFLAREPRSDGAPFRVQRALLELDRGNTSPDEVLSLWEQRATLELSSAPLALRMARRLSQGDVPLALRILEDALGQEPAALHRSALEAARHLLAGTGSG